MKTKNECRSSIFLFVLVGLLLLINFKPAYGETLETFTNGRYVRTINTQWRFIRQDVANGRSTGLNDRSWQIVNLPYTWNNRDAFTDTRGYYRGPAWYRKAIFIGNKYARKQVFLKFGAANQLADVYVNGKHVIQHKGGYTAFAVNITKWVNFGESNIIAVRVDNSFNKDIPPLSADFTFFGGIYRNVWMIFTNPVHIAVTDYASPGVFIHTSGVSNEEATVNVSTVLMNNSDSLKNITLETIVEDATGHTVAQKSERVTISANETKTLSTVLPVIKNPHLWSPKYPYLYSVKTVIKKGHKIVDEERNPLGIRWYRFDPDKGFFLNGKHLVLRGVDYHQSYPGYGNAVPDRFHIQDFKMIKKMGANFVRLAHYPQNQAVLQAADRLGILIWQETPNVNYITVSKGYFENASQMLREMIHQYYNHPSIILWGFMNEIFNRRNPTQMSEADYDQQVVNLAKKLNQIAHNLDPSRKTTMAMNMKKLYNKTGLADVTDVVGWNIYKGWYSPLYNKKGENLFGNFLDEQHKINPNKPIIVSEYGAGADSRIHTNHPQRFDFSIEYQDQFHEMVLNQLQKRPYISGATAWIMFDFASEHRNNTRPWINEKGLVNQNRKPKEVYYFYKARLSSHPVVHIASHDWTHRTVPFSQHDHKSFVRKIKVYSNLPEVKCSLNGHSLGTKRVGKNDIAVWSVPLKIGENQLVAEGKSKGKMYSDEVTIDLSFRGDFEQSNHNIPQLFVNAGSHFQFYPSSGVIWEQDQSDTHHEWGYIGGKTGHTPNNIIGTSNDPVYQYYRIGMKQYHFMVPKGRYQVTIYLAEPKYGIKGKRIFSVAANGIPVFTDVDLAGTYGEDVPVKRSVILNVDNANGINIIFKAKKGEPIVDGISIERL